MSDSYLGKDVIEQAIIDELEILRKENEYLRQHIKDEKQEIRCATCGAIIKNVSTQRMTRPILWHSRECFVFKPRKVIKLERAFQAPIEEVLKITAKECGSIKAQCGILGVSIPYLYILIRRHMKMEPFEFFSKYSEGKRKVRYMKKIKPEMSDEKS